MKAQLQRRRVNEDGRAYAGSQKQIQSCVNLWPGLFTSAVADVLQLHQRVRTTIRWVSPLESDSYIEYRDTEFLEVLGLRRYAPELAQFWPAGGPHWDALARIENGCILVEAKSHVSEIYGTGCRAGLRALATINAALDETKRWLGVPTRTNWTGNLYQTANRYAHLHFLREKCSLEAYLVNVYFVGDPRTPTSEQQWRAGIQEVNVEMGITSAVPFSGSLFFDASKLP